MSGYLVRQIVREGEAGLRSADWAGWVEGLCGASQEEEQRRFFCSDALNCVTPAKIHLPSFLCGTPNPPLSLELHTAYIYTPVVHYH